MQKTKIEYLTHTWNPLAMRCTPVSSGCDNCWHLKMANRLQGNHHFSMRERDAYRGGELYLISGRLVEPFRRSKPAVIGVQFMGDLFHPSITNEQIAAVFRVMAACPHHRFIVLTKRPVRALEWFMAIKEHSGGSFFFGEIINDRPVTKWFGKTWPLPNVIMMTSIEDQPSANNRIPFLIQIPAAKRGVSVEPLLGEVDMTRAMYGENPRGMNCFGFTDGVGYEAFIDWITCGAETGPGKRPMSPEWARSLRDQCKAASIPFFFKKDSDGNHTLDGVVHEDMP